MFHLILAESALECVPSHIQNHASVRAYAKRIGRHPEETLLDNSWHYAAMTHMECEHKRGRPDIVHFSILAATSTPLYRQGMMRVYVHTWQDVVIYMAPTIRIPKAYHRFEGLFAKLLTQKRIAAPDGSTLLEAKSCTMTQLVNDIKPSGIARMSESGIPRSCQEIVTNLGENPCMVIGGFQKGEFGDSTKSLLHNSYSIWSGALESHVVVSRVTYEAENHFNG